MAAATFCPVTAATGYDALTYFQTIDAEVNLSKLETARKKALSEIYELWELVKDSTEADGLNELANALEDTKALDAIWDRVKARQAAMEDAEAA